MIRISLGMLCRALAKQLNAADVYAVVLATAFLAI